MCTAMEMFKKKTEDIGFERGESIGFERGESIGFERGRQFGINMIIDMFNQGLSIEDIAKYTNISQQEISQYISA